MLNILRDHRPTIVDEQTLLLTLANPWQKTEFAQHGAALMQHLREALHNDAIRLKVEIAEFKADHEAFTTDEQYRQMVQINPQLTTLKNKLSLVID